MNSLILSDTSLTMTTREIAELTSKDHRNVMADTRRMLEDLEELDVGDVLSFQRIYFDSMNRRQVEYALTKDLTLTLVAGYNTKMRHAIIKRWQELEAKELQLAFKIPQTMSEALILAGQQMQLAEERKLQLELVKPKVDYFDDYVNTDNLKTVTMTGKEMGVSSQKLGKWFRAEGYAFKDKEKGIIWTQPFINKGYGVMKQFSRKDGGYSGTQAYLTPNGEVFVKANYEPV